MPFGLRVAVLQAFEVLGIERGKQQSALLPSDSQEKRVYRRLHDMCARNMVARPRLT
jgi:hypothetical protein